MSSVVKTKKLCQIWNGGQLHRETHAYRYNGDVIMRLIFLNNRKWATYDQFSVSLQSVSASFFCNTSKALQQWHLVLNSMYLDVSRSAARLLCSVVHSSEPYNLCARSATDRPTVRISFLQLTAWNTALRKKLTVVHIHKIFSTFHWKPSSPLCSQ